MLNHIETFRAGESGYYGEHKRCTVDVWHDSKRYIYETPQSLKVFKAAIVTAFGARCEAKIYGRFPSYHVETNN